MTTRFLFLLTCFIGFGLARPVAAQLYDVRTSSVNYNRQERAALKVQVEGSATWARDFFQDWMKSSYNIRFKNGGVLGMNKSEVLKAKQTPASTVSGKLVDIYASVIAPSDSVSELAVFGAFDDNTFFDPDKTATEFSALRAITQNFAAAARLKAYREQIEDAEKKLKEVEKQKEKLEKNITSAKANTVSNLAKIEELKRQNETNRAQSAQDSVSLIGNAKMREASQVRLQRRRDRLSALDRKN